MKRYLIALFCSIALCSYGMKEPNFNKKTKSNHKRIETSNHEQDSIKSSEKITQYIELLINLFPESTPGLKSYFIDSVKSGSQDKTLRILNSNYPLMSGRSTIGKALIRWALINNYDDIIKLLVTRGIDLKHPKLIRTLLFQAIIKGYDDIVENILTLHDVPINCEDCYDHNPLIKAIGWGRNKIAEMLLNYSLGSVEIKRNMIEQALYWAFKNTQYKVIHALLPFLKQCS